MALELIIAVVVFILAVTFLTFASDKAVKHTYMDAVYSLLKNWHGNNNQIANSIQSTGAISTRTSWGSSG